MHVLTIKHSVDMQILSIFDLWQERIKALLFFQFCCTIRTEYFALFVTLNIGL